MGVSKKQTNATTSLALLTCALAFLELWGDMKGSLPALSEFNAFVQGVVPNGRLVALAGIFACGAAAAAVPRAFAGAEKALRIVVPCCAVTCSFLFALTPSTGEGGVAPAVIAVFGSGLCYGWFVIAILAAFASGPWRLPQLMLALIVSLVAKWIALPLVGALPLGAQAVAFVLAPIACGALLFAISLREGLAPRMGALQPRNFGHTRLLVGILVLFPVLNSVVRSFNKLGAWGGENTIAADGSLSAIIAMLLLAAIVYFVFSRYDDRQLMTILIRALVVLLAGFFLVASGLLRAAGFPGVLIVSVEDAIETLSGALFWMSLLVSARIVPLHPYRVIGLGQAVRNVVALTFGIALATVSDAEGTVVLLAVSAVALMLLMVLDRMTKLQEAGSGVGDLAERCQQLAELQGLTDREAEVLDMLAQGRSQKLIAEKLTVAESTVKTHVRHIYRKLGVSTKQELISLLRDR